MIDWTEADNRMQAHHTTTERINRQAWHRYADRPEHPSAGGARPGVRPAADPRRALAWCRAAARLLAVPLHRGAQPS